MNLIKIFEAVMSPGTQTLLDIGCGQCRLLQELPVKVRVGVDVWRPYLEWSRDHAVQDMALIHADADDISDLFLDDSFDVVTLMDVVEHFPKRQARTLIKNAERIARHQVLIFAPRGHDPQTRDVLGMGGDRYQKHRSQWLVRDFKGLGYRVMVLERFHEQKGIDAMVAHKALYHATA